MAIQVRRGLKKDFDPYKMLPGEWAVSIDNQTQNQIVWMCFAAGVVKRMGTYEDFYQQILEATTDIRDQYIAVFNEIEQRMQSLADDTQNNADIVIQIRDDITQDYLPKILQYVNDAARSASSATESEQNALKSANDAGDLANLSKSYAVGTEGAIRPEDTTDNAKEYARQAKESAAIAGADSGFRMLGAVDNKTDWNTLTDPGCYKVQCSGGWGSADIYHSPNSYGSLFEYGVLLVFKSAIEEENRIAQVYMPIQKSGSGSGTVLIRLLNGGKGYEWEPIFRGVDKRYIGLEKVDNTSDSEKKVASATKATQDGNGNNIAETYIPKGKVLWSGIKKIEKSGGSQLIPSLGITFNTSNLLKYSKIEVRVAENNFHVLYTGTDYSITSVFLIKQKLGAGSKLQYPPAEYYDIDGCFMGNVYIPTNTTGKTGYVVYFFAFPADDTEFEYGNKIPGFLCWCPSADDNGPYVKEIIGYE